MLARFVLIVKMAAATGRSAGCWSDRRRRRTPCIRSCTAQVRFAKSALCLQATNKSSETIALIELFQCCQLDLVLSRFV